MCQKQDTRCLPIGKKSENKNKKQILYSRIRKYEIERQKWSFVIKQPDEEE